MRLFIYFLIFGSLSISNAIAQQNEMISTIDFVEILNSNKAEAQHYYQNNWQELRKMAVNEGYIDSYQLLETPYSEEAPFHMILITTYLNKEQYDKREDHFRELIEKKGELNLLNEKKPSEFRNTVFSKEMVAHLE